MKQPDDLPSGCFFTIDEVLDGDTKNAASNLRQRFLCMCFVLRTEGRLKDRPLLER